MQEAGLEEELIVVNETWGMTLRAQTREVVRDYISEPVYPGAFCFHERTVVGEAD